ncbi:hypothetical protein V8Z74_08000 [Comamonas sp. w2-DMI]|uniref:hypothetical protein n=1 Tax=Comamonas sp. w2-DMI TaxID=3126391 RepID=UPI0032E43550
MPNIQTLHDENVEFMRGLSPVHESAADAAYHGVLKPLTCLFTDVQPLLQRRRLVAFGRPGSNEKAPRGRLFIGMK